VAREIVLFLLLLLVCGPLSSAAGLWRPSIDDAKSGTMLERIRWTQIWLPLFPAAFAAMVVIGWALREEDIADEVIHPTGICVSLFFALVWIRAAGRALRALRSPKGELPAQTRGFVRPRIRISKALSNVIDHDALHAAYLHEAAHARHGDPFRIWLAQIATDIQSPSEHAKQRFDDWLMSLELARDEEARVHGADGAALATAILAATRLQGNRESHAYVAAITGRGEALRDRVERLLAPLPDDASRHIKTRRRRIARWVWAGALALGIALGMLWGEEIVQSIPGVVS
jgi:hypothetical protein